MYLCCLLPYVIYYPTVVARYSLFVLKVPLNPKQANKQYRSSACPYHIHCPWRLSLCSWIHSLLTSLVVNNNLCAENAERTTIAAHDERWPSPRHTTCGSIRPRVQPTRLSFLMRPQQEAAFKKKSFSAAFCSLLHVVYVGRCRTFTSCCYSVLRSCLHYFWEVYMSSCCVSYFK